MVTTNRKFRSNFQRILYDELHHVVTLIQVALLPRRRSQLPFNDRSTPHTNRVKVRLPVVTPFPRQQIEALSNIGFDELKRANAILSSLLELPLNQRSSRYTQPQLMPKQL